MAVPDAQRIIWEHLTQTGTALYTAVGTRVWHSGHPDSDEWPDTQSGVIFNVVITDDPVNEQTEDLMVEFKCYGANRTHSAGQAVARALKATLNLQSATTASGYIHRAWRTGNQSLVDPSTKWPYTLSRYTIILEA